MGSKRNLHIKWIIGTHRHGLAPIRSRQSVLVFFVCEPCCETDKAKKQNIGFCCCSSRTRNANNAKHNYHGNELLKVASLGAKIHWTAQGYMFAHIKYCKTEWNRGRLRCGRSSEERLKSNSTDLQTRKLYHLVTNYMKAEVPNWCALQTDTHTSGLPG